MTGKPTHHRRLIALVSSAMLSIVACHRPSGAGETPAVTPAATPTPNSNPAPLDSVRGTLLLVGNEPVATLLLAAIDRNSEPVAVTGALMPVLRRVIGLEIVLFGHKPERAPPTLRRVVRPSLTCIRWIAGSLDGAPASYGLIIAAR